MEKPVLQFDNDALATVLGSALPEFRPPEANWRGLVRWSELAADADLCRRVLDEERRVDGGLDAKGQAASFVNRVGFFFGVVVAALDMSGRSFGHLAPSTVAFRSAFEEVRENGRTTVIRKVAFAVAPCSQGLGSQNAEEVNRTVAGLFRPLIGAVARASGLGVPALWRLVSDGLAAAYLSLGREARARSMFRARAEAILAHRPSPLWSKELRFIEIAIGPEESAVEEEVAEIFRLRGGCCRYYTSPTSDGETCTTCVLRTDREERLREYLATRVGARRAPQEVV